MSHPSNDSIELLEFTKRYRQLREFCDDLPENLIEQAKRDKSVSELCVIVHRAASEIREWKRCRPALWATAGYAEINAWRDYEARFDEVVFDVALQASAGALVPISGLGPELEWMAADILAQQRVLAHSSAMLFALTCHEVSPDRVRALWEALGGGADDGEDRMERAARGARVLLAVKQDLGLDMVGVFRRRALIPFVLVPDSGGRMHDETSGWHAILGALEQAQNAFVYGAPYAAVALLRSLVETILRDFYAHESFDQRTKLHERIRTARLPVADKAALRELAALANSILHSNHRDVGELAKLDERGLELEIVKNFRILRALIERRRTRSQHERVRRAA